MIQSANVVTSGSGGFVYTNALISILSLGLAAAEALSWENDAWGHTVDGQYMGSMKTKSITANSLVTGTSTLESKFLNRHTSDAVWCSR